MDIQELQSRASGPEQLFSLRDFVMPLFRHRKLVLSTFLTLLVATIMAVVLPPKLYQAQMEILVKHARVDEAVSPGRTATVANPGEVTEEQLNSEVALLRSRDLLEKVVLSCNLRGLQSHFWNRLFPTVSASGTHAQPNPANLSGDVSALENQLSIEPLRKTNLIQVTYDSRDPVQAKRVLSVLGDLYLEKTALVHSSPGAFAFFQSESHQYDEELRSAESRLAKFDREAGVTDPKLEKQITLQELAEFESKLNENRVAVRETEKQVQTLEGKLVTTPRQTISQVHTAENAYLIRELKTTLLNLQLKRTDLLEKFQPDYRPVQEVQKQIEQTLGAIANAEKVPLQNVTTDRNPSYVWLHTELAKSTAHLAVLRAGAAATQAVIGGYRARLRQIDSEQVTHQDMARSVKEDEGNYLLYVQKREEARIDNALNRERIVNAAIAEAPTARPARPRSAFILLVGSLFAGMGSIGLAYGVDYLDPSFRTPDELRETLQIPVLAALPK